MGHSEGESVPLVGHHCPTLRWAMPERRWRTFLHRETALVVVINAF
jgi:hypothetical protein